MQRNIILALVLGLFLAGGIGYYIYSDVTSIQKADVGELPLNLQEDNGDVEEEIADTAVPPASSKDILAVSPPDLARPVEFVGLFTPESKDKLTKQIKEISELLAQDSTLFNQWIDLALLWKTIGDYEGARQAWEYASAIRPKNSLSSANLGNLYGYYLKNPQKAEENLLQAIANNPKLTYLYLQTADFYLEVLDDRSKAQEILERGIVENPGEEGLKKTLEHI